MNEKIRKILPQLNKSLYMVSFVMNLILSQIHTKKKLLQNEMEKPTAVV